jgi:hypothetical protein
MHLAHQTLTLKTGQGHALKQSVLATSLSLIRGVRRFFFKNDAMFSFNPIEVAENHIEQFRVIHFN